MQRNRMTWMAAMLGMAAVSSLVGCGKGMSASNKGAATLNVHNMLQATDAKSAKVVVQGAAESVNLTIPLVANATSTQWSAIVSDLPIGTDYVFTASAYAADGTTLLYTGAVSGQSIAKNQTANIAIDMNQVAPSVSLSDEAPVINGLSETASCVSRNDTVVIKATAHDPDAGDTAGMAWAWSVDATCGTLSAPVNVAGTDTTPGTSTVTFTATSSSANCQVNLTIADARQPAVLMTTGSVTVSIGDSCSFGNAKITAIPNTCPVVANVGASVVPVQNTPSYVPMVVGQSTWVSVSATDADNDTLLYSWSSPDCAGGTPSTTFGNFNAPTNTAGTWFLLTSAPTSGTCTFLVHVSDGTFADGKPKCDIVNHLSLPVKGAGDVVKANPVFGFDYQSKGTVNDGDTVKLEIVAPTPSTCPSPYTLVWSPAGTPLATLDPPFTTGITFTAPTGAGSNGANVTVTATCPDTGLNTVHSFALVGTNAVCNGAADGTDCTSTAQLTDKCVTAAKCATGQCVAQTSVTCPASTVACQTNVCGHTTDGQCHLQASSDGTACNDGLACTTADKCAAGTCGGTAVVCTASGNACQTSTCAEPSGTCVVANAANGTTCNDGLACTTGDTCTNGTCAGTQVSCPSGQTCFESGGGTCQDVQCSYPAANAVAAFVPTLNGIGGGTTSLWDTGKFFPNLLGGTDVGFNFGANTVTTTGSADLFLNKLDPTTGKALASFSAGNGGGGDQIGAAVAVAGNGNPVVIGSFTAGKIVFSGTGAGAGVGTKYLTGSSGAAGAAMNFYMVVNGTTSTTGPSVTNIGGAAVDMGTGALIAAASNPSQNTVAICGKIALAGGDTGAGFGGLSTDATITYGGATDIIVAVIDATTGSIKWGHEFGGAGDQQCTAIAMDASGNVYIAGTYNGALDFGGGHAFPTVATTGLALPYAAVLSAATGTVTQAATWGTSGNNAVNAIATNGTQVYIGGALGASTTFGSVSLTDSGLTDAFVLKMNASLTPQCGVALGDATFDQSVKGLGLDPTGATLYVGGAFTGTLSPTTLVSANSTLDGFTIELGTANCTIGCPKGVSEDKAVYNAATNTPPAGTQTVGAIAMQGTGLANLWIAGLYSSTMSLGSGATLVSLPPTGSAGTAYNYVAHLVP